MQFNLLAYFTRASTAALLSISAAILCLGYWGHQKLFHAQDSERSSVRQSYELYASRANQLARQGLISQQEQSHVSLSRLLANSLWKSHLERHYLAVGGLAMGDCSGPMAKTASPGEKSAGQEAAKACMQSLGARIRELPSFSSLHQGLAEALKDSAIVQVKLYDRRGITIYSSEASQTGEGKFDNPGWQSALAGQPATELTFRDQFSTFERVVQARDILSSYLPFRKSDGSPVQGVIEVYSDVTPLTRQLQSTQATFSALAAEQLEKINLAQQQSLASSRRLALAQYLLWFLLIGLFYLSLHAIVKHACRKFEEQEKERDALKHRLAQFEAVTSLGQTITAIAQAVDVPVKDLQHMAAINGQAVVNLEGTLMQSVASMKAMPDAKIQELVAAYPAFGEMCRAIAQAPKDLVVVQKIQEITNTCVDELTQATGKLINFQKQDWKKASTVNINRVVASVVYIAQSVLPSRIKLVESYENLPRVACNVSQINQAIQNLLANAMQAIGDAAGEIEVSTTQRDGKLNICIRDSGCGIPPEQLPRIFEPHFTTKVSEGAAGLGLSIARDILKEHGGNILVRSKVGEGSVFTLVLPFTDTF